MDLTKRINFIPTYRYHPETLTYRDNVLNTAETISERSLQHVDKFVRDSKEAGIWNLLTEVMPFAGIGINAGLTKLKYQNTIYATATNFIAADFSEATGLTGNGSTKYINLNYNASLLSSTGHFAFYQRTDNAQTGNRACLGAISSGATDNFWLGSLNPSVQVDARYGQVVTASAAGQMVKGFYYAERSSTTNFASYRNNVQLDLRPAATVHTPPNLDMFAWGWNSNGTPLGYNSCTGSFLSIGATMTAQQRADYYSIIQTLQVNLGRAV